MGDYCTLVGNYQTNENNNFTQKVLLSEANKTTPIKYFVLPVTLLAVCI